MSTTELMKEPKNEPTVSLFPLSDVTLTVRGWRQIETELPKAYQVPVVPPLLQSRARQASSQRGTVWHGTKGAVVKTTVLTSMKPQSHVTEVVSLARLEVALLIVRDLPSQRGKARKIATFGSRVDVIEELIASFFMRVRLVSLDKPLLPDRQVATAKVKGSLARTRRRRDHVALVALRAQRAQSPKDPASSSKPSPAAVCLVASMLASVSQAFFIPQPRVLCPSIRFNESPDVFLVKARGNLRPIGNQVTKDKVTFHEDISLKLISLP